MLGSPALPIIFDHARTKNTTFENRYYGPYDKLLNYCFRDSFKFYVAPQSPPRDDRYDAVDFAVFFVVFDANDKPVLIVEVKDESWAMKYALLLDECPLPRLWGLSLLGTTMRIYCGDTKSYDVSPSSIPRLEPSTRVLPPGFLEGEWQLDILSAEGFAKMNELVTDILEHTTQA